MQTEELGFKIELTAEQLIKFQREASVHDYEDTLQMMEKGIEEARASYYRLLSVNAQPEHLQRIACEILGMEAVRDEMKKITDLRRRIAESLAD